MPAPRSDRKLSPEKDVVVRAPTDVNSLPSPPLPPYMPLDATVIEPPGTFFSDERVLLHATREGNQKLAVNICINIRSYINIYTNINIYTEYYNITALISLAVF